jgi:hypothetical protein
MRISHGRSGRPFDSASARSKWLLRQVLGVVMVAAAVVRVAVDVAEMRAVELAEGAVELRLVHHA